MWWSISIVRRGQSPADGLNIGSFDGTVLGEHVAKREARRIGKEYIRTGGPGQPRLVKSPRRIEQSPDLTPLLADPLAFTPHQEDEPDLITGQADSTAVVTLSTSAATDTDPQSRALLELSEANRLLACGDARPAMDHLDHAVHFAKQSRDFETLREIRDQARALMTTALYAAHGTWLAAAATQTDALMTELQDEHDPTLTPETIGSDRKGAEGLADDDYLIELLDEVAAHISEGRTILAVALLEDEIDSAEKTNDLDRLRLVAQRFRGASLPSQVASIVDRAELAVERSRWAERRQAARQEGNRTDAPSTSAPAASDGPSDHGKGDPV